MTLRPLTPRLDLVTAIINGGLPARSRDLPWYYFTGIQWDHRRPHLAMMQGRNRPVKLTLDCDFVSEPLSLYDVVPYSCRIIGKRRVFLYDYRVWAGIDDSMPRVVWHLCDIRRTAVRSIFPPLVFEDEEDPQ